MTTALFVLSTTAQQRDVFSAASQQSLAGSTRLLGLVTPEEAVGSHAHLLAEAQIVLTSWGAPVMDEAFLSKAPKLKAVFYAGGTVRYFVTDALWKRGVRMFTAQAINAIPTSEFAAAAIVLGLKRAFHFAQQTRQQQSYPEERNEMPGTYRRTVGLVSLGSIGLLVRRRLASLSLDVLVHDPYLPAVTAAAESVTLVSLEDLFRRSDVVSLHTPLLPETANMIREEHLRLLKPTATFVNTARGGLVEEAALLRVIADRPDVQFLLDVAAVEPPVPESALYRLPNVFLTPHIAGSGGSECARLGEGMVEEAARYAQGRDLRWELDAETAARTA